MRKWLLIVILLLGMTCTAQAEARMAGPADSGLPSLTETLTTAEPGDVILLADGVYDSTRETFPIMVDKAVTLRPAEGAKPVIRSPEQTTAMKITAEGASVSSIRFEHIRCAVWVLADHVTITECDITLVDENWRTSSSGIWIAGAKHAMLTDCSFTGCGVSVAGPPVSDSSSGIPVLTAMFEVGEDIEFFTTHTIADNLVNGEPLCYLIGNEDQVWKEEAGQIIAVACKNMTFSGLELDFTSIGIQLAYCRDVTVAGCTANDCGIFGIYIMKSEDCAIRDTRADRGAHGIDLRDAKRVVITNCVTNDCGQGTFLSWGRNCLVQGCEILNNGTGFFSASGGDNHVDACRIEGNELGMYVQHEDLFTLTDSVVKGSFTSGFRVTDSGVMSLRNTFADNFVGHLALDCAPVTHMDCVWTNNENCDMFVRNGKAVKLLRNTFDGPLTDHCQFEGTGHYICTE